MRIWQVIRLMSRVSMTNFPPDVSRARRVEEDGAFWRVEVRGARAVTVAVEKLHRHEGIKKVWIRARVELQLLPQLGAGEPMIGKCGEWTAHRSDRVLVSYINEEPTEIHEHSDIARCLLAGY